MLDINVAGTFGRTGGIDNVDGGLVIFMMYGRAGLGKAKLMKDGTKILGNFGGMDSSDDGRLDFGLVGNSGASEAEAETGDRMASLRASGMRGIDETSELKRCETSGETRK